MQIIADKHPNNRVEGNTLVKQTMLICVANIIGTTPNRYYFQQNNELRTCKRVRNIQIMAAPSTTAWYYNGIPVVSSGTLRFFALTFLDVNNRKVLDNHPIASLAYFNGSAFTNSTQVLQTNLLHTFDLPTIYPERCYIEMFNTIAANITRVFPFVLYYE
jgi:hypothetical protein